MHPIYHYSCISWPRYSKNPKFGVSFSFVFIGIFSDNFFFRTSNHQIFIFHLHLNSDFVQSLGYPYPAALISMSQSLIKNLCYLEVLEVLGLEPA